MNKVSKEKSLWERKPEGFPKGNGLTQGLSSCNPAQICPNPRKEWGLAATHYKEMTKDSTISWVRLTSRETGVKLSVSIHSGHSQPTSRPFKKWIWLFVPLGSLEMALLCLSSTTPGPSDHSTNLSDGC